MVNFRKITEENFDATINRKRPEGVASNAVSPARAWPYRNQKRAWKAANFPGVSLCNVQSTVNKPLNCNLKRRALHPNACSAGLSSLHSWVPLGSFLHAVIEWEIHFSCAKSLPGAAQESRRTYTSGALLAAGTARQITILPAL